MNIGEKIRYLRIKNNLNQEELGIKLGVADNSISSYESGSRSVSLKKIAKLAEIFGVEQSYFLDSEEPKEIDTKITNRMILEDMLDNLIEKKIITDPHNIDKSTIDMLIGIMKKDIEDKLKKQL